MASKTPVAELIQILEAQAAEGNVEKQFVEYLKAIAAIGNHDTTPIEREGWIKQLQESQRSDYQAFSAEQKTRFEQLVRESSGVLAKLLKEKSSYQCISALFFLRVSDAAPQSATRYSTTGSIGYNDAIIYLGGVLYR